MVSNDVLRLLCATAAAVLESASVCPVAELFVRIRCRAAASRADTRDRSPFRASRFSGTPPTAQCCFAPTRGLGRGDDRRPAPQRSAASPAVDFGRSTIVFPATTTRVRFGYSAAHSPSPPRDGQQNGPRPSWSRGRPTRVLEFHQSSFNVAAFGWWSRTLW